MRVKSEEKRQAILEIAKDSFTKQGFEQTSMSHIAKMLGGSKATLYNYFSSKEEIFTAGLGVPTTEQNDLSFLSPAPKQERKHALFGCWLNFFYYGLKQQSIFHYQNGFHETARPATPRE
ncbi:TetR/AcrR family transcriptional regulator, partial [Vibrio cholerae]|uniref:TetR/AcrR family transcriptional regulator n=1 Tax=Vibrio cholerae TaxID=666 RepID=UPI00209D0D9F